MSKLEQGMLLDTHTWIWLFQGSTELSENVIVKINQIGSQGKVFISAISVWELSMLVAKGRVTLSKSINNTISLLYVFIIFRRNTHQTLKITMKMALIDKTYLSCDLSKR